MNTDMEEFKTENGITIIENSKGKQLGIGDKVMLVNRAYAFQNKQGGRILIGRVSTYCNFNGIVEPVFQEIGSRNKKDITMSTHIPFIDLQKAIDSISIKTKKK